MFFIICTLNQVEHWFPVYWLRIRGGRQRLCEETIDPHEDPTQAEGVLKLKSFEKTKHRYKAIVKKINKGHEMREIRCVM